MSTVPSWRSRVPSDSTRQPAAAGSRPPVGASQEQPRQAADAALPGAVVEQRPGAQAGEVAVAGRAQLQVDDAAWAPPAHGELLGAGEGELDGAANKPRQQRDQWLDQ